MPKRKVKGGGREKRAWRKAPIEDVEEAAEDARLITRLKQKQEKGGSSGGDELFFIDTKASSQGLSRASRREVARAKLFPTKAANIGPSAAEEGKMTRAENRLDRKSKRSAEPEVFDLWGAPPPKAARSAAASFPAIRRAVTAEREHRKMPKTLHQKVGLAPAVIPAHEGQSMNPESQAYEDLACMAAARQIAKERDAEEIERQMMPMTHELRDVTSAGELKGMDEEAKVMKYRALTCKGKSAETEDAEEGSGAAFRRTRRQKSQAQRNKERKRVDVDAKVSQELQQRRLEKSVGEVGAILKEMKDRDELHATKRQRKKDIQDQQNHRERTQGFIPRKRRLGGNRTKFEEQDMVVPKTEAAARGLRAMPLSGSAVQERISSIMRRGLLPAPPEASRYEAEKRKKSVNRVRGRKKFVSPLLRDNLLINRRVGKAR